MTVPELRAGRPVTVAQIARMIDHSMLRPELTLADVIDGCTVAAGHQVASVCCKPADVAHAAAVLRGTGVDVGSVVGFPHGNSATDIKVAEARRALDDGAAELDMVLNIGRLRGGQLDVVGAEIAAVVAAARPARALVKVILETAYLCDEEKVTACRLSEQAGAAFVKTSTGFAPSGATMADVILMRASVGPGVQVKAAGGVRTLDALLAMAAVGVTRFGATATAAILAEAAERATRRALTVPAV